jgi:Acyl CoA binding protein
MEGDVEAILPRPSLPSTRPDTAGDADAYEDVEQSQLRSEREARAETEKWDAWHACAGLSRTEAKRRYIEVLIETMKIYAAGTAEARDLVEELEFVWNQIRSQSGSEGSLRNTGRAEAGPEEGTDMEGRLRVLSPVSRGGSQEIVEGEDASIPEREVRQSDDDAEEERQDAPHGPEQTSQPPLDRRRQLSPSSRKWRGQLETALTKISTEMAALREQIDELNTSSYQRLGFSIGRRKGGRRILAWMRWIFWIAVRQLAFDAALLAVLLLLGVWRGDDRFERWIRRRWTQLRSAAERMKLRWGGNWDWDWDWTGLVVKVVPARFL